MRHHSLPLLAVLALAPRLAAAQDFPPLEETGRLHLGDQRPDIGPILGVGIGWGGPFNLNFDGTRSVLQDFKAGRFVHGMAGVRFGGFGLAALLRRGEPGVARSPEACPPQGGCTATSAQNGGLVMFNSAGDPGSPVLAIGVGFWMDQTEITDASGAFFRRYEGWGLFEYFSVEARIGGPTSHVGLGGYGLLGLFSPTRKVEPAGTTSLDATSDSPGWAEIGLRVSFF